MGWKFWHQPGPRELPDIVRQALEARFHLDARTMDALRLLDKPGLVHGQKVQFIRVFDPSRIGPDEPGAPSYDDLQMADYRKALCFEGHIARDRDVFLADRRPPRIVYRPINLKSTKPPAAPSP